MPWSFFVRHPVLPLPKTDLSCFRFWLLLILVLSLVLVLYGSGVGCHSGVVHDFSVAPDSGVVHEFRRSITLMYIKESHRTVPAPKLSRSYFTTPDSHRCSHRSQDSWRPIAREAIQTNHRTLARTILHPPRTLAASITASLTGRPAKLTQNPWYPDWASHPCNVRLCDCSSWF